MKPYYADDFVTLYHADCRDVLPALERFRLLMTDPPYGIAFASQPTKWQRLKGMQPRDWDDSRWAGGVLDAAVRQCDQAVIWGGNYYQLPPARCWLSWHKPDAPPSMGNVEYAWTNLNLNSRQMTHSISATNAERVKHPTQKPRAVMMWAISYSGILATPGRILDPFAGSGTTLRAAKDLGLQSVGVEIDESYCEIAAERCRQEVLFGDVA